MKGKLILKDKDEYDQYDYSVFIGEKPFDYELEILTDLSEPFTKLISTTKDLDASIISYLEITDDPEITAFYKNCQKNKQELFQNIEYVEIDYDINRIIEYIKNNPYLQNKKIIINDYSLFSLETINKIKDNLSDVSNLYFYVTGNYNLIGFNEYYDFILTINNIIDDVKKYNFSVFETIMYVYDIVRDKIYQEVSQNENKYLSRNLTSSLTGDKIVCLGYANIFKYILDKLDIKCQVVLLGDKNKKGGHARNEIYIKDPKYNIDGVYYFDPTWDRKKDLNDNTYLLSYRYFALTREEMDNIDFGAKHNYRDELMPIYSASLGDDFKKIIKDGNLANIPEDMFKTINHMAIVIDNNPLISKLFCLPNLPDFLKPNLDNIIFKLNNILTYFDKPLAADTYIKALYRVRQIEYYKDPYKYPFTFFNFYQTLILSKWQFTHHDIKNLLYALANKDTKLMMDLHDLEHYFDENDLNRQMYYLKLTRTLRNVYEKKTT